MILIAITLIAAIAIAGFVFGLFGSFTSTAQVSASVTSCSISAKSCVLSLDNTGSASTTITGGTVTFEGKTTAYPTTSFSALPLPAGATTPTIITLTVIPTTVGEQIVGSITLANGGSVSFSGTVQA